MRVDATDLPEVLILDPTVFEDDRGFFMESWNARDFAAATGLNLSFVQDNHSRSSRNVLRGIHYQLVKPQGKLVRVTCGTVLDVAVDLRRTSTNFGRWVGVELSDKNKRQLWIPPGFGHAFVVKSDTADFLYKTTEYWYAEYDRSIRWDDPTIGIEWSLDGEPLIATKDARAPALDNAEVYD